ncbi:glycosyltransferase [Anditalea andensis]|uniref:Streptomycin biosynthesis protein StrF domain-containing protein n=1 Tax=Anditalea andensis TaxID=1048983 RepID=A0A074L481_9BACT|nr:glycosyltransferase [Anditalea andensis]KEO75290.1 hypothetical protein EL17_01750 [Anditalea andensis]
MISIVICSIRPHYLATISENIKHTIGVPYEIIAIENKVNPKGLTAVYNEGVHKAKFEHICLVHEDVLITTQDWGKTILKIFQDPKMGLVGVAGCRHKPRMPSGWGALGLEVKHIKINLIQHFKRTLQDPVTQYWNTEKESISQVACLDGVFLLSKKSILKEIPFDETTFKGFHCYDLDISFAIGRHYKVAVTYDILIEHFSEGHTDYSWIKDTMILHRKWQEVLPITIGEISKKEKVRCEKKSFKNLAELMRVYTTAEEAIEALNLGQLRKLNLFVYLRMYYRIVRIFYLKQKPNN